MPISIRVVDNEVDSEFSCRLCGDPSYNEEGDRTMHPGKGRPLHWINNRLCDCCYEFLEIWFRNDGPDVRNDKLQQIKIIESSRDTMGKFIEGRKQMTVAQRALERNILGSDARGTTASSQEALQKKKILSSGIFYPEANWPRALGDPTSPDFPYPAGTEDGKKGYYVYDFPQHAVCM